MSLQHEFCLVPNTVDYFKLIMLGEESSVVVDSIAIPDDLIQYIGDSLSWIPSKNPAKSMAREEKGINYHGITLFDQSSAAVMKSVFLAWHFLFTNSPERLKLTGEFMAGNEGATFNKDEILQLLGRLISLIEKLEEGNLHLYHLGI